MALVKCFECGNEISEYAKFCPKCGALGLRARGVDPAQRIIGGVIAAFGLAMIAFYTTDAGNYTDPVMKYLCGFLLVFGVIIAAAKPRRKNKNNGFGSK